MKSTVEKGEILLERYLNGTCNEAEKLLVEAWYNEVIDENPDDLKSLEYNYWKERIAGKLPLAGPERLKRINWSVLVVAASLAVAIFGVWFFNLPSLNDRSESQYGNDIKPGSNKATITLANGKLITLSTAKTMVVIDPISLKYNDGSLVQKNTVPIGVPSTGISQGLMVSTPRGGTYQITLQDGTKVWLNAASSLKFPSTFGNLPVREVELNGEAYFEVAKNKIHPFIVISRGQEVKVLGTHFNITSYEDEPSVKTTLLEGSVKVNDATLKPNQQAVLSNDHITVQQANTEEIMAWKNGYFRFNDEKIESIMKKIARWYNIEVQFKGKVTDEEFKGTISRNKNISEVLELLESTKTVHFKVEGRRVTVMN